MGICFINSQKFSQKYIQEISKKDFLMNIYSNIFDRATDIQDYNY